MSRKGFTLIELLVVISIISVLSSILLSEINIGRVRARDTLRVQNIHALQIALSAYYNDHGEHPKTFEPGDALDKRGECVGYSGGGHPDDYIPNLAPTYIAKLPSDPNLNCA